MEWVGSLGRSFSSDGPRWGTYAGLTERLLDISDDFWDK